MTTPTTIATRISTAVVLALTLVNQPIPARAADGNPPSRMTYQSFLTDANGVALGLAAPKNYDVIFRIYNDQTAGNELWAEEQTVTVDKGYFSVLLGEGNQVNSEPNSSLGTLFTGTDISDRYVQMTVKSIGANNGDVDIKPRLRLMTSPYAFVALNALYAASLVNNSNSAVVTVSSSCVGINKLVPNAALDVNGNASVSGSVSANTLNATNATLSGAFVASSITASNETLSGTLVANNITSSNGTISAGTFVGNGTIPVGGIIMWSGATNTIPAGWALCNGQTTANGQKTPNLTDRFVIGAGASYSVSNSAGSSNVWLTANQIPPHQHAYEDGYLLEYSGDYSVISGWGGDKVGSNMHGNGSLDSNNDTIFWRPMLTSNNVTTSSAVTFMPPYFALAYIMRYQ